MVEVVQVLASSSSTAGVLTPGKMAVFLSSALRDTWACECPSLVTLVLTDLNLVLTKDRFEMFSSSHFLMALS